VQTSADESWAIQIAAFKDATLAEVERKRLESKLPYKIDILRRPGEAYSRLIVGHYPTKDKAITLKQELITKHKLDSPFPVKRN
jgi:cell division septation protein DedD